jgi:magnesium chelatase family protein
MLVAATNPCPCGRASKACQCNEVDHRRHRRRLSGPLLDRIDLHVAVDAPEEAALLAPPVATTAEARTRVLSARERQAHRLEGAGASCNADMPQALVPRAADLPAEARDALRDAYSQGKLSARGHGRVLRVARTLADLDGCDTIEAAHVLEAIALRRAPGDEEAA